LLRRWLCHASTSAILFYQSSSLNHSTPAACSEYRCPSCQLVLPAETVSLQLFGNWLGYLFITELSWESP